MSIAYIFKSWMAAIFYSRWPQINSIRIFGGLISYFKFEVDWCHAS